MEDNTATGNRRNRRSRIGSRSGGHWPTTKGPRAVLARRDHMPAWETHWRWMEHLYRRRQPDGTNAYVAEPYAEHLDEGAHADLAFLEQNGYTVELSWAKAEHFPGRTVAVIISASVP